jgi:hypothetical protein
MSLNKLEDTFGDRRQEFRGHRPRKLVVKYMVGAFMAVMTWWLDGGASCRHAVA